MQNEERQLNGYYNEQTGISAVECLLPAYYRNGSVLSVHIIEVRVSNILVFYYLLSTKSTAFGTVKFILLTSHNDEVTNKPDPLDSLTWKWYESPRLIDIVQILPRKNWAPFICDKIAQGVCLGLLSMDFTDKEAQQKRWELVINNTIDHLTGLNHGGKEN